jgi:DNA repair exonuclease SbcCD ATPase subunit
MADLKLSSLTLRNWMKFATVSLDFPESGLVMVTGHNRASGGALLSVGSGKTGFGEAISRTLLGVPGRFTHLRQFSTHKHGDTYVRVEAMLHGKPLVVEAGYKCPELSRSGEALRFSYDGKEVERGLIQETRAELVRLIGVTPALASWTVFVDGDSIRFNKLSQADSVELVLTALRQPPWHEYHEVSKKTVGRFRQILTRDTTAHSEAQRYLREATEDVKDAKEDYELEKKDYERRKAENDRVLGELRSGVTAKSEAIEGFKKRQQELARSIKAVEKEKSEANHKLEIKRNDLQEVIRQLENKRPGLLDARDEAMHTYLKAKNDFQTYEGSGKVCPTCKRPMTQKLDPERLANLKAFFTRTETAYEEAKKDYSRTETVLVEKKEQMNVVNNQINELGVRLDVSTLSDEYADLDDRINETNREIHRQELEIERVKAGASDRKLNEIKATLAERERVESEAKKQVEQSATVLAESKVALQVLEYWNQAFSPYGIPNMVLKDAIAPLNREARRISAAMTGGTIAVNYSTRRELASGAEKAELVIEVDNKLGSDELAGSSKGETGLTNLIVAETLCEVGQVAQRIGYRWYDEVVPHQDQVVCQSIYARLRDIAQRFGILIFMVDHNPVAANYADHFLVVEKSSENSEVSATVKWR